MLTGAADLAKLNEVISQCIRKARKDSGLKQTALSRRLGITPAALCYIEGGHNRVRVDMLVRICAALGIDPVQFFAHIMELAAADVPRETSP